jgi:hypothetical protein
MSVKEGLRRSVQSKASLIAHTSPVSLFKSSLGDRGSTSRSLCEPSWGKLKRASSSTSALVKKKEPHFAVKVGPGPQAQQLPAEPTGAAASSGFTLCQAMVSLFIAYASSFLPQLLDLVYPDMSCTIEVLIEMTVACADRYLLALQTEACPLTRFSSVGERIVQRMEIPSVGQSTQASKGRHESRQGKIHNTASDEFQVQPVAKLIVDAGTGCGSNDHEYWGHFADFDCTDDRDAIFS